MSVGADGRVLFMEQPSDTGRDLWVLGPDGKATPIRVTPANENEGRFSPDSTRVAYSSDESGRYEVYVQDYPSGANRVLVSTGGGFQPRWSRDGRELFFRSRRGAARSRHPASSSPPRRERQPRRF